MRRFLLKRENNPSNTDTEVVGEGCVFSNGKVATSWYGHYRCKIWWNNMDEALYIHKYDGKTHIEWIDNEAPSIKPPVD